MYDVAVIGAGIAGCSIARELSRHRLRVIVLEKGADVATGASKANSGIVHAGYDAKPGTWKARFNIAGQRLFDQISKELDFPFRRCGSLVIALTRQDIPRLHTLKAQGEENGLDDLELLSQEALRRMEPNISDDIPAALHIPRGGITSPYEMTVAYGENAAQNGVEFVFGQAVQSIQAKKPGFCLLTQEMRIDAGIVVNAGGVFSDRLNNQVSSHKITIIPRRGEYCLLDKSEAGLVSHTIFQLPTPMGKGVLVTPTTGGNILVGPTSHDIGEKEDTATTREGLEELWQKGSAYLKRLPKNKVITSFAGLRAHAAGDDFIVGQSPDVPGWINVAGIESPGLSSAPAIAKEVERLVVEITGAGENPDFDPNRKAPPKFRALSKEERRSLIARNPDYGRVICRCEQVTRGEILDAMRSPLPARDLDSIKRRTRTGMGRCQGGFCNMRLLDIIAKELGVPLTAISKDGPGTELLLRRNKEQQV